MNFVDASCVRHTQLHRDEGFQEPGKSHARKFTAAMAIPTPKRTPASTRFEPPSPKAKVRPATTIATSERPRAMVLVKAVIKTLTAFSQGEFRWAKAGAARNSSARETRTARVVRSRRAKIFQDPFIGTPRLRFCIAGCDARKVHASDTHCGSQPERTGPKTR